jgi:hypothetical protein
VELPPQFYRKTGNWLIALKDVKESELEKQQLAVRLEHGVLTITVPLAKKVTNEEWF